MGDQWYYSQKGQQVGPVTPQELQRAAIDGGMLPSDFVWKQGMAEWVSARRLKGLFVPPPLPSVNGNGCKKPTPSPCDVGCPHCAGKIVNDSTLAGKEVGCPHCNGRVIMPVVAQPTQMVQAVDDSPDRSNFSLSPSSAMVIQQSATNTDNLIRRIADYERISGALWLGIAIIQILTIFGIIAGIWNIYAAITRFGVAKQIRAKHPGIPKTFEPITGLIVIGLINLIFGGVIGLVFVGFDFYIRDKVLTNAQLFQPQLAN